MPWWKHRICIYIYVYIYIYIQYNYYISIYVWYSVVWWPIPSWKSFWTHSQWIDDHPPFFVHFAQDLTIARTSHIQYLKPSPRCWPSMSKFSLPQRRMVTHPCLFKYFERCRWGLPQGLCFPWTNDPDCGGFMLVVDPFWTWRPHTRMYVFQVDSEKNPSTWVIQSSGLFMNLLLIRSYVLVLSGCLLYIQHSTPPLSSLRFRNPQNGFLGSRAACSPVSGNKM